MPSTSRDTFSYEKRLTVPLRETAAEVLFADQTQGVCSEDLGDFFCIASSNASIAFGFASKSVSRFTLGKVLHTAAELLLPLNPLKLMTNSRSVRSLLTSPFRDK